MNRATAESAIDHAAFVRTARGCAPPLAAAMERVGPPAPLVPPARPLGAFLVRVVVGQQLSSRAAATIRERLEAHADAEGLALPGDLGPETAEALRGCGLSRGKIRTLQALREAERDGVLDEGALAALDADARARTLSGIHGVGRWSCDMVSLFHFRDPDVWPGTDQAVQRTLRAHIDGRRSVARTSDRFAPRRSTLARYLWRIADAPPD